MPSIDANEAALATDADDRDTATELKEDKEMTASEASPRSAVAALLSEQTPRNWFDPVIIC